MSKQNKILIIDDEERIRKNLKRILEKAGYETDTARDGEEALEKIKKGLYNLVLIDTVIPGEDKGLELLRIIKSEFPETIVIMFTGYEFPEYYLIETRKHKAYAYLKKPINSDQLKSIIKESLEEKKEVYEEFDIEVERLLYERYGKDLEEEHKGEFIAISFDGEVIYDEDDMKVLEEASKKFGQGKFIIKRIGYDYVYEA